MTPKKMLKKKKTYPSIHMTLTNTVVFLVKVFKVLANNERLSSAYSWWERLVVENWSIGQLCKNCY